MKRFFTKAFEQGFIAVLAGVCTSPLLAFSLFFGMIWVLWIWIAIVVVVFLLGGIIDWISPSDEEPYYIHD